MIVRCLICIPTYNNSGSIQAVVNEILHESTHPILILDDGSDTPVSGIIESHPRINIHRFEKNSGKGKAIQKCFEIAIKKNFTHIITIDGDGQHKAKDLVQILDEIKKHPWDLIIGKRQFSGEHVPKSSQFGRKFSNFWVTYQTDQNIEDSQSGFRAYPLYFVQHMKFFTSRYDFEIEVLIRLMWNKVTVREVTIDVYYPPPAERVSHFDKFWDNVKISSLNTVLVALSLLHSNTSRWRITFSVALGVFVGILPIFGFQMYLGMLLAVLFRLNFPLMFLAQQISIPPLIPIWTFISLQIGSFLTGEPLSISIHDALNEAQRVIPVWILGSIILGLLLAVLFGTLAFFIAKKKQTKKQQWTGKDRGGKFGNWFMQTTISLFGPNLAYFFLLFICPYFYLFAPKAVRSHNQFFKISKPEWGFFKRQIAIVKTFFKLGELLVDNFYFNTGKAHSFSSIKEDFHNPAESLKHGKGLVLAGAHMGGWIYATKTFSTDQDYPKDLKINIIQHDVGPGANFSDKVQDDNIKYISKSQGPMVFRINQLLNQNEILICMPDRLVDHNIELINFFGKLAPINSAAFSIAFAKEAPLAFCYAFKTRPKEYLLIMSKPVLPEETADLDKQTAIIYLAKKYTESLEHYLTRFPTQWFNFFPFWSSVNAENKSDYTK